MPFQIEKAGQKYVDRPIMAVPRQPTRMEAAIIHAFDIEQPRPILLGFDRIRLNWIKPTGAHP